MHVIRSLVKVFLKSAYSVPNSISILVDLEPLYFFSDWDHIYTRNG